MINQSEVKHKPKFVYNLRHEWSTDSDGNTYETKELLADNIEQVDKYLHEAYYLKDSDDLSDDITLVYSCQAYYNENGDLVDFNSDMIDPDTDELKDGFYTQTETISASQEELTQENYEYFKNGQHWTTVIDLTKEDN